MSTYEQDSKSKKSTKIVKTANQNHKIFHVHVRGHMCTKYDVSFLNLWLEEVRTDDTNNTSNAKDDA